MASPAPKGSNAVALGRETPRSTRKAVRAALRCITPVRITYHYAGTYFAYAELLSTDHSSIAPGLLTVLSHGNGRVQYKSIHRDGPWSSTY